ncbi:helix-turn-helix domain-containing protein [Desulfotruncus arcticus]|nr:helix-turn-helix domain-containing protein [Desulfotruncus arcticus]
MRGCTRFYLTQHRLQQARRLLISTEKTIDEIAYAVGYSNNIGII